MSRVNLVILWHMHQPQYRDPGNGAVCASVDAPARAERLLGNGEDSGGVSRGACDLQFCAACSPNRLRNMPAGNSRRRGSRLLLRRAESLTVEQKREALERAFQVNENLVQSLAAICGIALAGAIGRRRSLRRRILALRDWRDLQLLSQLAWMDEEYLAKDPVVRRCPKRARISRKKTKQLLREKQHELLAAVLPEYRLAAARGQIEISTTPYYHPILPLLCDTDIARISNPHTPLPHPPFRYPEDAREQLVRARQFHERVFGKPPVGLVAFGGLGFRPGARNRHGTGIQMVCHRRRRSRAHAEYRILARCRRLSGKRPGTVHAVADSSAATKQMSGFFRDHYLSDLVGFVYSRMGAEAAAEDLHRRIRAIGDREPDGRDRHRERDSRWRKRLGILSGERPGIPAASSTGGSSTIRRSAR